MTARISLLGSSLPAPASSHEVLPSFSQSGSQPGSEKMAAWSCLADASCLELTGWRGLAGSPGGVLAVVVFNVVNAFNSLGRGLH